MAKRELTSLFVAFFGAWLLFQALLSTVSPLLLIVTYAFAGFRAQGALTSIVVGAITVVVYSCFGLTVIRNADRLACWLLRRANISAEGRMDGFELNRLFSGMISLLGLYFLIRYVPELIITGFKWFTYEARSGDFLAVGGSDPFIAKSQSSFAYSGAVVAIAAFVFLRADFLSECVARFRKVPNHVPDPTPASVTPAAEPPARLP